METTNVTTEKPFNTIYKKQDETGTSLYFLGQAVSVLGRQGSNAGVAAPFAATCGR